MARRRAELDDLAAGAYVYDADAETMYEILDRRSHHEEPDADPVERVRVTDAMDPCADEETTAEPKWVDAELLVGRDLVRAPTGQPQDAPRTLAKLR